MYSISDKFLQFKCNHFLSKLNESFTQLMIELVVLETIRNVKHAKINVTTTQPSRINKRKASKIDSIF